MSSYTIGQRWISEMEPELGLGSVIEVERRHVRIRYAASGGERQYATTSAPLTRVRFQAGDQVQNNDGVKITIESVVENDGLLTYHGEGVEIIESDLSDAISFDKPEERLLAGQVDTPDIFDVRLQTLQLRYWKRKSSVRGFLGARIDSIPHQLYIASEVAQRRLPRALLADEVGLGKTIEACLILHRLLLSGRAQRALILTPETLTHQWFVELLRRFNVMFHIYDEERCAAIEEHNPGENPFWDDQLVLCSLEFLAGSEQRAQQAIDAGWDFVAVDEAHRLRWSPEEASPEYALVEKLAALAPALLLLTATPEQLGPDGHFARLRLLDPQRYSDFETYRRESENYRSLAELVEALREDRPLAAEEREGVQTLLQSDSAIDENDLEAAFNGDAGVRERLVDILLDLHGAGRVMFRNTRAAMDNFPKRIVHRLSLDPPISDTKYRQRLFAEIAYDIGSGEQPVEYNFKDDPRIPWLGGFLLEDRTRKMLVICRTKEKALAIEEALRTSVNAKIALFHEDLSLVQRDRNAAWFGEPDGAQALVCSEIGSEGRNFQFAHHLVLFDLPADPDLLEQRIGRLDRIGQKKDINIHVPFVRGTAHEALERWYAEGLGAFEQNLPGGGVALDEFGTRLRASIEAYQSDAQSGATVLDELIADTRKFRDDHLQRLEQGRDRLLEYHSFRSDKAAEIAGAIAAVDDDARLDNYLFSMYDLFGLHTEELSDRVDFLKPGSDATDAFPELPEEGMAVTTDRKKALDREDIAFLSWDHPLVRGGMELLIGSERGNSSFAVWHDFDSRVFLLESIFVLECVAPPNLHLDRFLPPAPVRIVVNSLMEECTDEFPSSEFEKYLGEGLAYYVFNNASITQTLLPNMFTKTHEANQRYCAELIEQARAEMRASTESELERLRYLHARSASVSAEEIALLERELESMDEHIAAARPRLDALRLIWKGPSDHRLLRGR